MNWKEILLNLGTPVVETLIADQFDEIVVFQKDDRSGYVVIESKGIVPERSVYDSEDDIKSEFPDMELVRVTENVFYLVRGGHPELETFRKIEELSEKIRNIEKLEARITRHIYQLRGMDTVISSLLEPIPTDILLSMLMDALSELFVASVGLYRFVDEEYVLFTSLGSEDFPDSLPKELSDSTKLSGIADAERYIGRDGLFLIISEELVNAYIIYVKRSDTFTPEERALLEAIAKIISRTREYMKSREKIVDLDRLLNQSRFVVESLGEFSQRILSTHSIEDLENMLVDMLREMLQSSWTAMYRSDGFTLRLVRTVSVRNVKIPNELVIVRDFEDLIKGRPEGYISGYPKDTWLVVSLKPESVGEYVILFGPPVTDETFLGEIFEIYIDITVKAVEKAFESIKLYEDIKEREERISKLHESLEDVRKFIKDLRKLEEPSRVYEFLFEYSREKLGVNGLTVKVGGLEMEMGEKRGEVLRIELENGEKGSIEYYKDEFDELDENVLRTLTDGALASLRGVYLMIPSQKVLNLEEVMLRFLREKAVLHGMSEDSLRFFKVKGFGEYELLEKFGVAVVTDGEAVLATTSNPEDLEKAGLEVEEM